MSFPFDVSPLEKRIEDLLTSKVSPLDLLPSALGLRWGMFKEECLALLGTEKIEQTEEDFRLIILTFQKEVYSIRLVFNGDYDTLNRIGTMLFEGTSFDDFQNYPVEQRSAFALQHLNHYLKLQNYYISIIGSPVSLYNDTRRISEG